MGNGELWPLQNPNHSTNCKNSWLHWRGELLCKYRSKSYQVNVFCQLDHWTNDLQRLSRSWPHRRKYSTLCLKKNSHLYTLYLCSIFTDIHTFYIAGKRMKFATKPIQHYPPHLKHVAILPWEIKNSNFWPRVNCACVSQRFKQLINTTLCPAFLRKFACQPLCCVPLQIQTSYQNLVFVAEYHVDRWQTLQWHLL